MTKSKRISTGVWGLSSMLMCFIGTAQAETNQQCLIRQLQLAAPNTTVSTVRAACNSTAATVDLSEPKEQTTPFERRVADENQTRDALFAISPHGPNYVLPVSYNNSPNSAPYAGQSSNLDHTEVKFQLSLKAAIAKGVFHDRGDIFVAYTNRSWWQAYNKDISSPFRETNHEPEIYYSLSTDYDVWGMKLRNLQLGVSHQSNGRGGDLSRSWNRVFASVLLEKDNFYLHLKPWWRIPESKKKNLNDPSGDDNPDISKYLGYGELSMFYKLNDQNISMMVRNNLRSDNKGAVQLNWSFPLNNKLRGYVQYFNGYGESLIDYNASVSRFSLGFMLTDWL